MYVYIHTRTTIVSEWPTEFPDVHPAMVEMSLLMLGGLQRSRNASTKRPNIWTSHRALHLTNFPLTWNRQISRFVFQNWILNLPKNWTVMKVFSRNHLQALFLRMIPRKYNNYCSVFRKVQYSVLEHEPRNLSFRSKENFVLIPSAI